MKKSCLAVFMVLAILTGIYCPANAAEESKNIAKGKVFNATSSWIDNVWDPVFLTDGHKMESWPLPEGKTLGWRTPALNSRDVDVTLTIDLTGLYTIDTIVLYPRGNGGICFPDDYSISVSNDGQVWDEIVSVTGDTNVSETARTFTFNPFQATCIKIHITRLSQETDGGEMACELSEVEIWGTEVKDGRTNVAPFASVSCSSSYTDDVWHPAFLTDGFKMGSWPLPSGETLGWRSSALSNRNEEVTILFTLEDISFINEIILYPRGNGGICFPDDYTVSISEDNLEWTIVAVITGDTEVNTVKRTHLFEGQNARYVKINLTKTSEETDGTEIAYELSEIEIWGKEESKLKLNKKEIWFSVGEKDQIIPFFSDGSQHRYEFEIIGDEIITVSSDGTIQAVSPGNTSVKITSDSGDINNCSIKVYQEKKKNIMITVPVWGNKDVISEEQFTWLREADIDTVMAVGHDLSQDLTLKMLKTVKNIWNDNLDNNLGMFIHTYTQGITPLSTENEILAYVTKYKNTPALMGYHIEDEPFNPNPYARIERILKKNDPDCIADINFLPGMVYSNYQEYYNRISDYCKLTGEYASYISFDNYPFGPSAGMVDETNLFGNFEMMYKAGLENNVPTAFYVQGVGSQHFGYRRPDENLLRYHIASAMAYNFKWIKYFSWYVPGASDTGEADYFTDAIMDKSGQKTELYDAAAKLNKQVHNVGEVLVNLDVLEVYHSGDKSINSAYKKVTPDFVAQPQGNCNAILSYMVDKTNGEQYLMIVNKDFTHNQMMSFQLQNVNTVYELDKDIKGGTVTAAYTGGILTREFIPGEFALFKLSDNNDHSSVKENTSRNLFRFAYTRANDSISENGWFINNINNGTRSSSQNDMGWKAESSTISENWLLFDMKKICRMNRIDLYPSGSGIYCGNLFPESLAVYISDDCISWEKVYENTEIKRPTVDVPFFRFDTVSARYVKIVFPNTIGTALAEVEAYLDDGSIPLPGKTSYQKAETKPDVNLAFGRSVKSSNSYNDPVWNAANITDGIKMESWPTDKTLGWSAGYFDTIDQELWISVDLETVFTINKVVLYPRGNGGICFPADYEIQVSLNGIDWTTVYRKTGDSNIGEKPRIIEFDDIEAKYVRLFVTKLSDEIDITGYSCQISEFEVYNKNEILPEYPDDKPENDSKDKDPGNPQINPPTSGLTAPFMLIVSIAGCLYKRKKYM